MSGSKQTLTPAGQGKHTALRCMDKIKGVINKDKGRKRRRE